LKENNARARGKPYYPKRMAKKQKTKKNCLGAGWIYFKKPQEVFLNGALWNVALQRNDSDKNT